AAGAAAKTSGAVGGDCVIAVAFEREAIVEAQRRWAALGAEVLEVSVEPRGVRTEACHGA
ncbi:MAG: hypothetical protein ACREQ9_00985, partial [Candidatus Binatia bacterium]